MASLTLIMTTSGSRRLPGPTLAARRALLSQPANREPETLIAHSISVFTAIGSPGYRPAAGGDARARRAPASRARQRPQGSARQLLAIAADGDRTPLLARIQAPTQVIHGVLDPLVPVANGHDLVRRIPGALGDFIEGMGHDLPQQLLARIAQGIAAQRAARELNAGLLQARVARAARARGLAPATAGNPVDHGARARIGVSDRQPDRRALGPRGAVATPANVAASGVARAPTLRAIRRPWRERGRRADEPGRKAARRGANLSSQAARRWLVLSSQARGMGRESAPTPSRQP